MPEHVTAVVLAAGASRRMGELKQLLPWGDTTILGQTLRNLRRSKIADIFVVTGHAATRVAAAVAQPGITIVHNQNYARGEMLSSLQAAIPHLAPTCQAILVVLADQPMVEAETIDRLLDAYATNRGKILAPAYRGRRGNPVLFDRRLFSELRALPWGHAPRDLLRRHQDELELVEVETDTVLRDLDHPDEYLRQRPKPPRTED